MIQTTSGLATDSFIASSCATGAEGTSNVKYFQLAQSGNGRPGGGALAPTPAQDSAGSQKALLGAGTNSSFLKTKSAQYSVLI
jgi:hypothetical protein